MGKSLVIVESPSKATIINRYLGDDYVVKASVGHIRDLATAASTEKSDKRKTKTEEIEDRMANSIKEISLINEANFINKSLNSNLKVY